MISAVVFDCDGVLFDSWRANVAFYNAVLEGAGLPPMDAEWERRAHVMASSQLFDAMFAAEPALLEQVRAAARATDYEPFYSLMEPVAGLYEVLDELARSYRLAMASNRGRTLNEVARRFGLDRRLLCVVGVLDVTRPKPEPDMLLACLERLGVGATEALFVGDAVSDREAARAAGMHFVAAGAYEWSANRIESLRDLPGYLRSMGE
jgi:HAD superfamily hydrolase (TIGR01509 family)